MDEILLCISVGLTINVAYKVIILWRLFKITLIDSRIIDQALYLSIHSTLYSKTGKWLCCECYFLKFIWFSKIEKRWYCKQFIIICVMLAIRNYVCDEETYKKWVIGFLKIEYQLYFQCFEKLVTFELLSFRNRKSHSNESLARYKARSFCFNSSSVTILWLILRKNIFKMCSK